MVTGSCGLIGSEVCLHFYQSGYSVLGIDNNQRAVFFGPEGDTSWTLDRLRQNIPGYEHHDIDIRDREGDPSSGRAHKTVRHCTFCCPAVTRPRSAIAFDDFDTNAVGTLNLLEASRRWTPESPFIHMSTNKVLRRPAEQAVTRGEGSALGVRRSRVLPRYSRKLSDRPIAALLVRSIKVGFRCNGPRVRALLRNAYMHLARRLSHRTQSLRGGATWIPKLPNPLQSNRQGI